MNGRVMLGAALLAWVAAGAPAGADVFWQGAAGGVWGTAANWSPAHVPTDTETAAFNLGSTYTVFVGSPARTVGQIAVYDDLTTLNLTGTSVTTVGSGTSCLVGADAPLHIGQVNSVGQLRVLGGTFHTQTTRIGGPHNRFSTVNGRMIILGGAAWTNDTTLTVGGESSGQLTVQEASHATTAFCELGDGAAATALVTGAGSTLTCTGALDVGGNDDGTLTVEAGAVVQDHDGSVAIIAGVTATATITGAGSRWDHTHSLTIGTGGTGSLAVSAGGHVGVQGGAGISIGAGGTVTLDGGGLDAATLVLNGGALGGVGSVAAAVTNGGTLSPGGPLGTLSITGTYVQTLQGTLAVELGGTAPSSYGRLAVSGNASLHGTFRVTLAGGFQPRGGDSFTVLTGAAVIGVFDSVVLPAVPGQAWRVQYLPGSVVVSVGCGVDLDGNGRIEPTDIALFVNTWFTSLQQGTLAGDWDGDGRVEPVDIAAFVNAWFSALSGGC